MSYILDRGKLNIRLNKKSIEEIAKLAKENERVVEKVLEAAFRVSHPSYDLGPAIRAKRTVLGMSLDTLSKISSLEKGYLSRLERGQILRPGIATLVTIAGILGMDADDIVSKAGYVDGATFQKNIKNARIIKNRKVKPIDPREWDMIVKSIRVADNKQESQ